MHWSAKRLRLLAPESSPSCNSHSSHIINFCTHDTGIIMSVSNLPNSVLNPGLSPVPPGTTSMIRSPQGPHRIQQNYLVSEVGLRREEREPMWRRARESSITLEASRIQESQYHRSRVRGTASTSVRHLDRQLWYIKLARVSLYSTNSYSQTLQVRDPDMQGTVKFL